MVIKFISSVLWQIVTELPRRSLLAIAGVSTLATIVSGDLASADTFSSDYIFLLERDRHCQQIEPAYQEVKAFETANFYVNICQKDNNYYYLGEAKTGKIDTIFIPAYSLASGTMYRANNGNVTYLVNILPKSAILTIQRNGMQIARETSLSDRCIVLQGWQTDLANPIYYSASDYLNFRHRSSLKLNQIEIEPRSFAEFNSLAKYDPEAILNVSTCQ